jgi:hypothetical protein
MNLVEPLQRRFLMPTIYAGRRLNEAAVYAFYLLGIASRHFTV